MGATTSHLLQHRASAFDFAQSETHHKKDTQAIQPDGWFVVCYLTVQNYLLKAAGVRVLAGPAAASS